MAGIGPGGEGCGHFFDAFGVLWDRVEGYSVLGVPFLSCWGLASCLCRGFGSFGAAAGPWRGAGATRLVRRLRAGQRVLILVACGSFGFRRARLYTPRPRATAPQPLAVGKVRGVAGVGGVLGLRWKEWAGLERSAGARPTRPPCAALSDIRGGCSRGASLAWEVGFAGGEPVAWVGQGRPS
ncbi:uncharacterized protein AruCF_2606 [Achromobacter ruhlandii]|nr:uncharacterized protein AruCF_2606 [Achromobacter ruhlandii]